MSAPLIVFDLDGTLIDTNRDLIPALNHAIAGEGIAPVGVEEVGHVVGEGARRMIERAFELRGARVPRHRLDALHRTFLLHYETHIADLSRPYPGLLNALDKLAADGWRLAICTNKVEHLSRKLLQLLELEARFAFIAGADTFDVRKPDPGHIRQTVEAAGGSTCRALMVGDSINDVAAAQAVPMPVIAVDFGYCDRPVSELAADVVISHFDELPAVALKLLNR